MPALVRQRRSLVTLENYSAHELAVPDLVALGIRTAVAAPVWVQGRLAAALVAGSTRVIPHVPRTWRPSSCWRVRPVGRSRTRNATRRSAAPARC